MNNNPSQAQWPISNDDKKVIQDLGRLLHKTIMEYANAHKQPNGGFHWKLMAGAFQYVEGVMGQKQAMLAEDVLVLHDTVERYELGNRIEEPFQASPAPTMEQMRAEAEKKMADAKAELDMLDAAAAPAVEEKPVSNADATPEAATAKDPVLSPIQPGDEKGPVAA